jgi:hypothetical protein
MKTIEEYPKDFQEVSSSILSPDPVSSGMKGLIVGTLNKYCRSDNNRKQFLKALTGQSSSKDLTNAEWQALRMFLDPEDEGVVLSKAGELEIDYVISAAMPPQESFWDDTIKSDERNVSR